MPLVKATVSKDAVGSVKEVNLCLACREIIPAALNSPEGRLTPGSIEFQADRCDWSEYQNVGVLITVEAYYYEDREENLQGRTDDILWALKQIFPFLTFAVWVKLVTAGWASDSVDPKFDGDMSLEAAIARAKDKLINFWNEN